MLRGGSAQWSDGVYGRNGLPEELGGSRAAGRRGQDASLDRPGRRCGWRCGLGIHSTTLCCSPWPCPSLPPPCAGILCLCLCLSLFACFSVSGFLPLDYLCGGEVWLLVTENEMAVDC